MTPATTVHHLKSVRQAPGLKLDPANLETICKACHNQEHAEKAQALKTKQSKLKASKRHDVKVIKANPEIW
ncbi:HNH endonuclease [Limosilactobacillus fermentum]|nr:HNH endonuclease [Limosilactobacillus fermentum]